MPRALEAAYVKYLGLKKFADAVDGPAANAILSDVASRAVVPGEAPLSISLEDAHASLDNFGYLSVVAAFEAEATGRLKSSAAGLVARLTDGTAASELPKEVAAGLVKKPSSFRNLGTILEFLKAGASSVVDLAVLEKIAAERNEIAHGKPIKTTYTVGEVYRELAAILPKIFP